MNTTQSPTIPDDVATFGQVASRLKIHVSTLRRLWRAGIFPGYRVGRRTIRLDWQEVSQALRDRKAGRALA